MRKTKMEKGISLIALVITIVVLLILAVVAIRAIQDGGIIAKARQARNEYQTKEAQEESTLQGYTSRIEYEASTKIPDNLEDEEESPYIGYYADVDANGTVDGIIFADLAKAGSGEWMNSDGAYSWEAETNLKKYYISQENYVAKKENGNELAFGAKPVISPYGEGNDRFYVMSLSDFTVTSGETTRLTFTWYSSKYGSLDASKTDLTMGMTTYDNKRISYGEANTKK